MDENLVGYLLNTLDPAEQRQVEAYLHSHPEARQRLELFRQALEPLEADRDISPPAGLVVRTIARVAEYCVGERELPKAPAAAPRSFTPSRPFWRRADCLVAAALLLTALGLTIPFILQLRTPQAVVECQNNLRLVYGALNTYHEQHGKFPDVAAEKPYSTAGLAVPILINAGVWPEGASVRCPGNGPPLTCSVPLDQLKQMSPDDFQQVAPTLVPCYAYSLGYVSENTYHPPCYDPNQTNSLLPLVADVAPGAELRNSANHGGRGQNVLFQDGHVRFTVLRTVGLDGDDIYLNQVQKIAAGIGSRDTVLGPSNSSP